jgi:hypothetical protein
METLFHLYSLYRDLEEEMNPKKMLGKKRRREYRKK